MAQLNLEGLLITRSAKGMSLFPSTSASVIHVPTQARKVVDVSGAGDTVISVFTAAVASGASWESAASLANLASGIAVSKVGTSFVTPDELLGALTT
jgi:bifunctional ADP-heptose synthase (sugar kinase/adenylyltransferase)